MGLGPVLITVGLVIKDVVIGSTFVMVVDALMLTAEDIVFAKVAVLVATVLGIFTMVFISPMDEFRDEGTANFGVFAADMINPPPTEFVECIMFEELLGAIVLEARISA